MRIQRKRLFSYEVEDFDWVIALLRWMSITSNTPLQRHVSLYKRAFHRVIVAEQHKKIVGIIVFEPVGGVVEIREVGFHPFFVHQERDRRTIAYDLFTHACGKCKPTVMEFIIRQQNKGLETLLAHLHFKRAKDDTVHNLFTNPADNGTRLLLLTSPNLIPTT